MGFVQPEDVPFPPNMEGPLLEQVRSMLKNEQDIKCDLDEQIKRLDGERKNYNELEVSAILHNKNQIILQFCGWSINLYEDGTYEWEDTTGG